jgi:NAD-dependent oxidoreductase involved in siderophore biosynthesis
MTTIIRTDHHLVYVEDDGSVVEQRSGEVGRTYSSLQEYYRMQSSSVRRWFELSQALAKTATLEIIDRTATPQRIYATAGLEALIAAAEPGGDVDGIPRQQLEEMAALWRQFAAWSQTPLEDEWAHGKSPLQILSELGGA